jgi:uncharacterized Tic20 family protein
MNTTPTLYAPAEHEAEKASNSYLMSLVVVIMGIPLPVINLLATFFFYIANRKEGYFVRWHCTQALLSQFSLFVVNSIGFWWTLSILFSSAIQVSNAYFAYTVSLFLVNFVEFIATIIAAIKTRRGEHVSWWFFGPLTQIVCKK